MKRLTLLIVCVFVSILASAQVQKYVSPTGSGDGSIGSPWSLTVGLSHSHPDTTINLRGGVYLVVDSKIYFGRGYQSGSDQTKRAIIRNYPGERPVLARTADSLAPGVVINSATRIVGLWFGGVAPRSEERV
jgi:hypothetical protein